MLSASSRSWLSGCLQHVGGVKCGRKRSTPPAFWKGFGHFEQVNEHLWACDQSRLAGGHKRLKHTKMTLVQETKNPPANIRSEWTSKVMHNISYEFPYGVFFMNSQNNARLKLSCNFGESKCNPYWDIILYELCYRSYIQRDCHSVLAKLHPITFYMGVRGSWSECHFVFSLVYQLCLALW